MRIHLLAVGRLRPPFADDVQHYRTLLGRHTRLELTELREDEQVTGRIPDRAYLVLMDAGGRSFSSEELAEWLEQRRQSGRDLCFVICGAPGPPPPPLPTKKSFGAL